jgi:hypothetical protein
VKIPFYGWSARPEAKNYLWDIRFAVQKLLFRHEVAPGILYHSAFGKRCTPLK